MAKLTDQLEKLYPLLTSLRIAELSRSAREPLPHFLGLLLATAESPDRRSCCFVFPDASRVACTAATLLALSKLTQEFDNLAHEYAQRKFELGQRVMVRPTGHVFEYAEILDAEGGWSKRFRLKVLGRHDLRALPISDILRLEPTTRKSPKGKCDTPLHARVEPDALDTLVGIQSWGNRSMFNNRILYLASKAQLESFLGTTVLRRADSGTAVSSGLSKNQKRKLKRRGSYAPRTSVATGSRGRLLDVLPWGSINEDGSLISSDRYQVEGEPLLTVTHSVENVAEASMQAEPFSRVVFVDGPERLIRNLQACDEIADSQKVIVVAGHESTDSLCILEERDFFIWHVTPEEVQLGLGTSNGTGSVFFNRTLNAANNYKRLELEGMDCRNGRLEDAANDLDQAGRHLDRFEGDEEARRCLQGLFHLLFRISDRCTPPGAGEKTSILDRIGALEQLVERRAIYIPAEVATSLRNSCAALRELTSNNSMSSPIGKGKGEALLESLKSSGVSTGRRTMVVTRYLQSVDDVRSWLRLRGMQDRVVWYRHFPEDEGFDTIIVLSWLNAERFGRLVRRYAAPHVRLLSYPFERKWLQQFNSRFLRERTSGHPDRAERSRLLGLPEDLLTLPQDSAPAQSRIEAQTQKSDPFSIFDIEQKIMRRRKGTPPAARPLQDTCPTRYVGFVGETYAYLTENHEVPVVTDLIRNGDSAPSPVPSLTVSGLEIGDFLLFREGSDRDVVRLFAEEMMGPDLYAEQRAMADSWRKALLSLGGSTREMHRRLRSYGLRRAESTVRSWMRNKNIIGPWKRNDVEVIAAAMGEKRFVESPEKVWEAIENVRSIHRRAGHRISEWLLAELAEKRDLVMDGGAKIDLDFGQFWIVEVEELGSSLDQYPAGRVNRLLWEHDY